MSKKSFYITTPIYYVNDVPHIGHAYTTVAADCIARYKRLKGFNVLFLTGTDEHGQKVEKTALSLNLQPLELADRVVNRFKELWEKLNISNNDFIRTTQDRHKRAVVSLWEQILAKGDIYLGEYEDWYCTPCESFFTEKQLIDGKCPDCRRPVEKLKEPSYFFRMGKYQEPLLKHIEANPDFIEPESKRNEIVSFVKEGLRDLSVSRTSFAWGIPVPDASRHIIYVWFDALTNYLTAAGYPDEKFTDFWPADIHFIGKDILRFHAVYWPAILLSAGLPLPKKIFAHGWWTVEGQKMSKSLGNVIDPNEVIDKYGVDAFRYFLLREVPFGLDGDFSIKAFVGKMNGDLANELGNLLSRTLTMIEKYRGGIIPSAINREDRDSEKEIQERFNKFPARFDEHINKFEFHNILTHHLWNVIIKGMNAYIEKSAPWKLAKGNDEAALSNILYTLTEGLRIIAVYIYPFMPSSAENIWKQLGIEKDIAKTNFDEEVKWGKAISGLKVRKGRILFPKVEAV